MATSEELKFAEDEAYEGDDETTPNEVDTEDEGYGSSTSDVTEFEDIDEEWEA